MYDPTSDPARAPDGGFKNWLHVFTVANDTTLSLANSNRYPWPLMEKPSLDLIHAHWCMHRFDAWPAAWKHFWSELEVLRRLIWENAQQPPFGTGARYNAGYGPYLMRLPGMGAGMISFKLVELKRALRLRVSSAESLRGAVLQWLEQYRALTQEQEDMDAHYRLDQGGSQTLPYQDSGASGGPPRCW